MSGELAGVVQWTSDSSMPPTINATATAAGAKLRALPSASGVEDGLHDERRHERKHPADAIHARDRAISRERPVDLRITAREPRKAGEDEPAQPFAERPGARESERAVPGRNEARFGGGIGEGSAAFVVEARAACHQRPHDRRRRRINREIQRKQRDGRGRERRGHAAVEVHADVEPPDARHEIAEAECPAGHRGAFPAARARKPGEEQREDDEFDPAAVRRRCERQRVERAEDRGREVMPERERACVAGCGRLAAPPAQDAKRRIGH